MLSYFSDKQYIKKLLSEMRRGFSFGGGVVLNIKNLLTNTKLDKMMTQIPIKLGD